MSKLRHAERCLEDIERAISALNKTQDAEDPIIATLQKLADKIRLEVDQLKKRETPLEPIG